MEEALRVWEREILRKAYHPVRDTDGKLVQRRNYEIYIEILV
jgi:hypothetical protein